MPTHCSAWGCSNRDTPESKENSEIRVTFHRIPKDVARRQQWKLAMKRQDWEPSATAKICSEHFKQSDFKQNSASKRLLNETAVPSIFNFPIHLQKKSPIKRKLPFKQRLEEEAHAAKR